VQSSCESVSWEGDDVSDFEDTVKLCYRDKKEAKGMKVGCWMNQEYQVRERTSRNDVQKTGHFT
jgi:hypothetical protein